MSPAILLLLFFNKTIPSIPILPFSIITEEGDDIVTEDDIQIITEY